MRVIPVLDLLGGVVVRGVAGRRSEYRPVVSCLAPDADPINIARGFREELGLTTLYVADLDAILHGTRSEAIYRRLADDGFQLWIDAGLRRPADAGRAQAAGASAVIAGFETWPGPEQLATLCDRMDPERVIFSLDMHAGRLLGNTSAWQTSIPCEVARRSIAAGVRRMIVLDLAQVGVGQGVGTIELCRHLRTCFPGLEVITGGGVRDKRDFEVLRGIGVDGVLVASALHDGRIKRADCT